jgi:hypothetical protein
MTFSMTADTDYLANHRREVEANMQPQETPMPHGTDSEGEPIVWLNFYDCDTCDHKWEIEGSCQCNDRCTECDREMEPSNSDWIGDGPEPGPAVPPNRTVTIPAGGDGDPDGLNDHRVGWAWAAVADFAGRTGLDIRPGADGIDTAMADLLANLMHLARAEGHDMAELLRRAATHFEAETLADAKTEGAVT